MKLSLDDKEDIQHLASLEGFTALWRLLESKASALEQDVLKLTMEAADDRTLIQRKLRAEGARKLLSMVKTAIDNLKRGHLED